MVNKNSPWYREDDSIEIEAQKISVPSDDQLLVYHFSNETDKKYFLEQHKFMLESFKDANGIDVLKKAKEIVSYVKSASSLMVVTYNPSIDILDIDPNIPDGYFRVFFGTEDTLFQEIPLYEKEKA